MRAVSKLTEAELIDLVENQYFRSVDGKDVDGTLACFAPDATLRVETAKVEHTGHEAIGRMFGDFMSVTKVIYHGDFSHVVNADKQLIASQFVARNNYDDGRQVERGEILHRWELYSVSAAPAEAAPLPELVPPAKASPPWLSRKRPTSSGTKGTSRVTTARS